MSVRKYFGTDGVRGHVGCYPITAEFALKLGWAAGRVLASAPGARVLIGKDTRLSGYMIESALEAGLASAGVDVYLLGPMPTPAVAYLTRTFHAKAGIVISASHNPHHDNGIKFFAANGEKLSDDIELKIEAMLDQAMDTVAPEQLGRAFRIDDAPGRYIEFCKSSLPPFSYFKGMKVVVDCAHGATYHIAPEVLRELGADVVAIGDAPDGFNINQDYGSTSPNNLQTAVLAHQADVGVALDGDGDRLIMVDAQGQLVNGDAILYILAMDMKHRGCLNNSGVVGTQMSNFGLEMAMKNADIPFVRAKVGDRYVMQALRDHQWFIGGESSGHIIWLNSTTTGDGMIAALQILHIMHSNQQSLAQLLSGLQQFPQVMINVPLAGSLSKAHWRQLIVYADSLDQRLGDQGRVLLRPSGTEPLIRVMVEAVEQNLAQDTAQQLAKEVEKCAVN